MSGKELRGRPDRRLLLRETAISTPTLEIVPRSSVPDSGAGGRTVYASDEEGKFSSTPVSTSSSTFFLLLLRVFRAGESKDLGLRTRLGDGLMRVGVSLVVELGVRRIPGSKDILLGGVLGACGEGRVLVTFSCFESEGSGESADSMIDFSAEAPCDGVFFDGLDSSGIVLSRLCGEACGFWVPRMSARSANVAVSWPFFAEQFVLSTDPSEFWLGSTSDSLLAET